MRGTGRMRDRNNGRRNWDNQGSSEYMGRRYMGQGYDMGQEYDMGQGYIPRITIT